MNVHHRIASLLIAAAASLAAAPSAGPLENDRLAAMVGERASVELLAISTSNAGDTGPRGSAAGVPTCFGFDEHQQAGARAVVMSFTGGGECHPEEARWVWISNQRVVEATLERIMVEVDWSRYETLEGKPARKVAGDRRTVTLRPGEQHFLDFLDFGENAGYRNAVAAIVAHIGEDPALTRERLQYELWLVDEQRSGERVVRRVEATGRQGEEVNFKMPDVRYGIPGAAFADGAPAEVAMEISTSIRGRLRPDGSIVAELSAGRWLGVAAAAQDRGGGVGDGGSKTFTLRPDETVTLELPQPQGSHTKNKDPNSAHREGVAFKAAASQGWTQDEQRVTVHFPAFFADHAMSLMLTVRRAS